MSTSVIGPCKPKSESWIPSISNLNPESLHIWKMNLRKVVWNLNPRNMNIFDSRILSNLKFESRILPFLKFESRISGLFEIWIQNPWTLPYRALVIDEGKYLLVVNQMMLSILSNHQHYYISTCLPPYVLLCKMYSFPCLKHNHHPGPPPEEMLVKWHSGPFLDREHVFEFTHWYYIGNAFIRHVWRCKEESMLDISHSTFLNLGCSIMRPVSVGCRFPLREIRVLCAAEGFRWGSNYYCYI